MLEILIFQSLHNSSFLPGYRFAIKEYNVKVVTLGSWLKDYLEGSFC